MTKRELIAEFADSSTILCASFFHELPTGEFQHYHLRSSYTQDAYFSFLQELEALDDMVELSGSITFNDGTWLIQEWDTGEFVRKNIIESPLELFL